MRRRSASAESTAAVRRDLQFGHLGGEPLVVGRPEEPVGERPLRRRRADRDPRRDEHEPDEPDGQPPATVPDRSPSISKK